MAASLSEKIMSGIVKGLEVVIAAKDGYDAIQNKELSTNQKVRIVGLNVLFGAAQIGEAATQYRAGGTGHLGAKIAVAGTSLAKDCNAISIKGEIGAHDATQILANVLFRIADIGECAAVTSKQKEAFKYTRAASGLLGVSSALTNCFKTLTISCRKTRSSTPSAKSTEDSPPPPPPSNALPSKKRAVEEPKLNKEEQQALEIDDEWLHYLEGLQEVLKAKSIKDFGRVPLAFSLDPVLSTMTCALSGYCVRTPMMLEGHDDIIYDKIAIEKWAEQNPDQPPKSWPEGLEFSLDKLRRSRGLGSFINRRLKELLAEVQSEYKAFITKGGQ